jgi:putative redox protein
MSNSAVSATPTGAGRFQTRLDLPGGSALADEPVEVGGLGTGPTPYQLLSAALAACTSMTLRLYAERKGWDLPAFTVEVTHSVVASRDRFQRRILFAEPLSPEWRDRLLEIADRCPVHRTLVRGFEIVTTADPEERSEPAGQHLSDMEQACAD